MLKNSFLSLAIAFCLIFSVNGKTQSQTQSQTENSNHFNSTLDQVVTKAPFKILRSFQDDATSAYQDDQIQSSTQPLRLTESKQDFQAFLESIINKTESRKSSEIYLETLLAGKVNTRDINFISRSMVKENQIDASSIEKKGTLSKLGDFPHQADIRDASTSKHKCSGTLVEDMHVLSSAHCVFNAVAWGILVMAGDITLLPDDIPSRETRRVRLIAVHPDYSGGENASLEFNIAILKLDMPFLRGNYLHPVMIASKKVPKNTRCFIVGWGLGIVDGSKVANSYDLYYNDVSTMDMENCYKCVSNAICAGKNQTEACIGDEGGPLICDGVLHGIYIVSANNCQSFSGIYADVVIYKHWIDLIIEWQGYGPMPVPLEYARKRSLTEMQTKLQNRSRRLVNVFNCIFPVLMLLILIPWR